MHLEGVIKGGAGGGKKDAKMLIAQASAPRMSFFTILKLAHNSTTWIFKFLIVINHLIIVAMIALEYLDLLQGVKFLFFKCVNHDIYQDKRLTKH